MNPLLEWQWNKNLSPESTAVIYKNNSLTYSALNEKINRHAVSLQNDGIVPGNYVGIISENNPDFIINIFALWRLGAIPVPFNTKLLNKEIGELIHFTQCSHVITDNFRADISGCKIITEVFSAVETEIPEPHSISEDKTAVIIFTSGSAGKPKGVELSFNNLIQSAFAGNRFLKQIPGDRWLASLPFYHVGGFSIFIRAFLFGAAVIIPDSLSAEDLCKSLTVHKPAFASLVSTQLLRLIENDCTPNNELRNVLLGGGFVETELITRALKNGWNVSKVYGSSETASMVTALFCKEGIKLDSAGKALDGNEIIIIDESGKPLTENSIGEILVKGKSIAKGYLNNPEETDKKFINNYYYSGDIGYLDEDGYLYIEARRTDLIISGGENINPLEVEKKILKHPDILEAAVFAFDDKEWGQTAAAAIVTKNQIQITIEELKVFLKDKLSGYKIPRKLFIIDELPKSPLGKIQREKLRGLFKRGL